MAKKIIINIDADLLYAKENRSKARFEAERKVLAGRVQTARPSDHGQVRLDCGNDLYKWVFESVYFIEGEGEERIDATPFVLEAA